MGVALKNIWIIKFLNVKSVLYPLRLKVIILNIVGNVKIGLIKKLVLKHDIIGILLLRNIKKGTENTPEKVLEENIGGIN